MGLWIYDINFIEITNLMLHIFECLNSFHANDSERAIFDGFLNVFAKIAIDCVTVLS